MSISALIEETRVPKQRWLSLVLDNPLKLMFCALMVLNTTATFAQKTVVQDLGGGRKMELDYNAADKVTETRTLESDGKLLEKIDYEYVPGYFGPQQTNTSYWSDGKSVRSVTRVTYDANSNFTGEFVQVYDESGKQVAGHRLTHDPMTGVYHCADWNAGAQDYKTIACPAGEEGGEGPEQAKKFTYEEVMAHLAAARKAAQQEQKNRHMHPMTAVQSPITTLNKEVGLVLPAHLQAGERISGIVVEDPERYEAMPEVRVLRVTLPFDSAGDASRLQGWNFEAPNEGPHPADGPVTFIVPRGSSGLNIAFRQMGSPDRSVTRLVELPSGPPQAKPKASRSFEAPALCLKGHLCTVAGPFGGDSHKTFAAFEERPATIVAETPDDVYVEIPDRTEAGSRPLFIAEGAKVIALPMAVGDFSIKNNGRKLEQGQTLIVFPTLDGPGDIPDPLWQPGNFPTSNFDQARKLIPGFQLPREDREARERREAQERREPKPEGAATKEHEAPRGGEILIVLTNPAPERMALRGSKNQMIVFHLNDESFKRGEFKYDLVVEALKPGPVEVKGYVIPFLAPIAGQQFTIKAGPSGQ